MKVTYPRKKKVVRRLIKRLSYDPKARIDLFLVTRLLKKVRGLQGKAWLVGGILTEGYTYRDIDIVLTDLRDEPKIRKALGSLSVRAHIIPQRRKPPAPIRLEITGLDPRDHVAY